MVSLILATLFTFVATVSHAATYYVATTGNDSNDGLSESTPWRTIGKAVNTMVAGDTTYVRGGTYNTETDIRFRRSGTAAAPIKLLNYPGERPIIDWVTRSLPSQMVVVHNSSGVNQAVGYITIEGFEIKNGWVGIKFYSMHDSVIRKNWVHDNKTQGILGGGGHHNLFDRNIVSHNGDFAACQATPSTCNLQHGFYMHGDAYTITNNLIYDNLSYGIVHNGSPSSVFDPTKHPSAAFAKAENWIIADNTMAYQNYRGGISAWGEFITNARYENNIFYRNAQSISSTNGIAYASATAAVGVKIKNNHFYATVSGSTTAISTGAPTTGYVVSDNVINVSAPAFVDAGATVPVTPNFTLTASAPVNIALANEFLNNSTNVIGPHKTVPSPTPSITTNKITLVFSSVTPIANLSTTGVTVACSGSACPGSPTVSAVGLVPGTDAQVDITIAGIAGNACEAANQNWTVSYNSAMGSWTNSDNIGPHSGLHQKLFSFTNLTVANNCTGSPPPPDPGTPYIRYKADEGTGTTLDNIGSFGASGDGTLTGGTWGAGHTGSGVVLTAQSGEYVAVPWGSGVNPTTQSFTVAFAKLVLPTDVSLSRTYIGSSLGTNQRWYVSTRQGAWAIGIQTSNDSTVSEIAVTPGWNYIVVQMDKDTPGSGTGTATLCVNRVCSTSAGGRKTYTSYTLASNLEWGRLGGASGGPGGTFDDFSLYLNATVSPNDLYDAFTAGAPAPSGAFAQPAVQAQEVYLDGVGGNPVNLGTLMTSRKVVAQGALAWLFQVHCTNVSDCTQTAFRLEYDKWNGSAWPGVWQQVPNTETGDGIYMWGNNTDSLLNTVARTTRLTGSCAVTNGVTLLTSSQIPSLDLPQDGCTVLAWIVQVGNVPGNRFRLRVATEGGVSFTGSYTYAEIEVIDRQAGGF